MNTVSERHIQNNTTESIEQIFEASIDPKSYNILEPTSEFENPIFVSTATDGGGWLTQLCRSDGDWQLTETSPSDSDNSEEDTSYKYLGQTFEVKPVEKQAFAENNLHLGFTISSGWSGTFFPPEIEDRP